MTAMNLAVYGIGQSPPGNQEKCNYKILATNCIRLEYSSSAQRSVSHANRKWFRLAILAILIWASPIYPHRCPKDPFLLNWNKDVAISTSKRGIAN